MSLWKIKLPRGKKEKLPELSLGELAYITDESELYIGGLNGENINITNNTQLNACVKKSDSEITLYVNNTSGNDNNDGLTADNAVKTLNGALNKLPIVLSANVNINLIGDYSEVTTNDYVYIKDKITTGSNFITIQSYGETQIAINNILAIRGLANYKISNVNLLKTLTIANCPIVFLNNIVSNADNCLWLGYTNVYIQNSTFTASDTCITAGQMSSVGLFSNVTLNGSQGFNINGGSSCQVQALTNNCTTLKTVATGSIYKGIGE